MTVFRPGATIGILGGGQLGRMLALAAAPLGYRCHIYTPETDSPAAQVSAAATVADYDDWAALETFAAAIDVATYEFENVPAETAERLAAHVPVRPGQKALATAQDRLTEKDFARGIGAATADYAAVASADELAAAVARIGTPSVLKTRRLGYDGKGQIRIEATTDPAAAWRAVAETPSILEAFVDFRMEVSVIAARGIDGGIRCYDVIENRHANHILDTSIMPARMPAELAREAQDLAAAMLHDLDYVGVMAVELFVTNDDRLLVNEIAPRVHNSGHLTIEATPTSQFAQHIRAICGQPLGSVERLAVAEMRNLIGDQVNDWPEILAEPGTHLHLYGKSDIRAGRKMGHVTRLKPRDG